MQKRISGGGTVEGDLAETMARFYEGAKPGAYVSRDLGDIKMLSSTPSRQLYTVSHFFDPRSSQGNATVPK